MRLPDSFSMRQRPTGVFRWLLHAPVWLYRAHLGFLLGQRFLLITHVGRTSGREYQTVVEVVGHDPATRTWIVCSGTGPDADWYRNLQATPAIQVQVGGHAFTPVQTFLDTAAAAAAFHDYERAHPATARRLLDTMGNTYDGTDDGRVAMMAAMPMIAFTDPARPTD